MMSLTANLINNTGFKINQEKIIIQPSAFSSKVI